MGRSFAALAVVDSNELAFFARRRRRIRFPVVVRSLNSESPLIVCPLEHERRSLARAGLGDCCELQVAGPGAAAIARWCSSITIDNRLVLLAGLAGGLHIDVAPGTAQMIHAVRRPGLSDLIPSVRETEGWTIASSPTALRTPDAKRQFAFETRSDLVDMESRAFAEVAAERRWRWGIVRGVSDSVTMALPRDIDTWVDARGRSRPLRVAGSLVRRPHELAVTLRLARHSAAAMRAVAQRIERLLDEAPTNR